MINRPLYVAWLVTLCGFLLSYFVGEVLGKEPCHLCWCQRICLFPLVLILGIANYRGDRGVIVYALPLALLGGFFGLVQVFAQRFPIIERGTMCGHVDACTAPIFSLFGIVTFPMMSVLGFVLITFLLIRARRNT